jgi:putative NADPH-quinone reductase
MHIVIIDGHPDPSKERFCHALAAAYADGASAAGHQVRTLTIAELEVPFLRSQQEWMHGLLPAQLKVSQDALRWAEHLVIIYPLWLGDIPAYLKAFLEQVARPGFAFAAKGHALAPAQLKGKSARIVVTMGMPAFVYRWFFFKHSLTSLKRNILEFVGIRPVRETIIGAIETADRNKWLAEVRALGAAGR